MMNLSERKMIKESDVTDELRWLKEALGEVEAELSKLERKAPKGVKLHAAPHRGTYQYFLRKDSKDKKGSYIRKSDTGVVKILAQIEYDRKLVEILRNDIAWIEHKGTLFSEDPFRKAEQLMHPAKRQYVQSLYISDDLYIQNWKAQEYEHMSFLETMPEYYASSGLRVRSKTEIIIADMLEEMGIPFCYEKPLRLRSGVVHPDFTLLDLRERREVYWEHFGMMDDMEYRDHAFLKILAYEESDIFQGDGLIWTFETSKYPINTKNLRKMLKVLKEKLGY